MAKENSQITKKDIQGLLSEQTKHIEIRLERHTKQIEVNLEKRLVEQTKVILTATDKKIDKKIDDFALMVQKGFEETAKKVELVALEKKMNERFDRIENILITKQDEKIDRLEARMRVVEHSLDI